MRRVSIGTGVTAASFAAGPLFVIAMFIDSSVERGGAAIDWPNWGAAAAVTPFAVAFGTPLAALPNLFGAKLLGELGWQNVAVRLPPVWALVGAGFGALLGSAFSAESAPAMAVVGAACALLCRWGTRWSD